MKKGKLKKLNIDFLYFEKKRKNINLIKQILIVVLSIFILFSALFHITKTKKLNDLQKELQADNLKIGKINYKIENNRKRLKSYKKNRKKLVSLLNGYIDKKGYPLEEDIKFIKKNMGNLTLFNFNYRGDFSIKIDIGSNDFNNLISFKSYLENKFSAKIISDEKKNGLYYQTLILKRKNE
jgi:hypothetical protein